MTNGEWLSKLRRDGHIAQNACAVKAMIGGLIMCAGFYVFGDNIGKAGEIKSLNKVMDAALKSGPKDLNDEYED